MSRTRHQWSSRLSRWVAPLLTLPLLNACWQPASRPGASLSVESGVLQDGRHVERLNDRAGPGPIQRIEVIRNARGERRIGIAMVRQQQASPGLVSVSYERPERCLLTSQVQQRAAQAQLQETVISSSCSWLPVGTRIIVQQRLQER